MADIAPGAADHDDDRWALLVGLVANVGVLVPDVEKVTPRKGVISMSYSGR
jgi:hypothetical protein